jgi:hypothetical protein
MNKPNTQPMKFNIPDTERSTLRQWAKDNASNMSVELHRAIIERRQREKRQHERAAHQ